MLAVDARSNDDISGGAYGALATRLSEAVTAGASALDGHAALLPQDRLSALRAVHTELAARRIRIAIYGEVKAGKSTLLNAIAGTVLSPDAFEPLTTIPVRVTYGNSNRWRAEDYVLDSVSDLEQVMRDGVAGLREVVVESNLDLLQLGGQVDLLDTPGVGSEERLDSVSADALRSLDAVVLVVRYPGLFTQFTRRLMDGLEKDIGKLFVVWNLDAACAELKPEERSRHAETLRARVAGAHDLYLVDARAGLRATLARDAGARDASGLTAFTSALARFASSEKRDVVALREAAKRTHGWLGEAERLLGARHTALHIALDGARRRLEAAQAAGEAERSAARAKFADVQAATARIGGQHAQATADNGARLIKQLRAARRRWIRRADVERLRAAVAEALDVYGDHVQTAGREAVDALRGAARASGADAALPARDRAVPAIDPIAPEERLQRAAEGNAGWLRRALWRRWYLPGIAAFERSGLRDDLAAHDAWFDGAARATESAARAILDARLADIDRRAAEESGRIKAETSFVANEAEFRALEAHMPIIGTASKSVAAVNAEARSLL